MPTTDAEQSVVTYLESLGANEGYGEELWRLYQANSQAVPPEWRAIFDRLKPTDIPAASRNGHAPAPSAGAAASAIAVHAAPGIELRDGDSLQPLRGAAARLASNMEISLGVPTATSQRTVPVGVLEANRRRLNQSLSARGQKLSMTPLLAWALVRALEGFPSLNSAYSESAGQPSRIERTHINLGLAVDVERASGRSLLVPVVKRAETLDFAAFFLECDRLVRAARSGKISPDDLTGASISLTNPGTIGTRASVPRLMAGQGAIIAAGAIAYPPGFEAVPEATLRVLGISKSFTLSCTYDHRIVQGAESGAFLARMHALLAGADGFYERIYADLGVDAAPTLEPTPAAAAAPDPEAVRKQAGVFQLVHMYRVRGHLQAAVDPLEMRAVGSHPELELENYGLSAADLDHNYLCPLAGRPASSECSLREIIASLQATYSGHLALEYMHLQRPEERIWLQQHMEPFQGQYQFSSEQQLRTLRKLTQAEEFERLLHARFVGHKRFSIEGGEALIPALDLLLSLAVADGAEQAVLGMSHRGRLNVLVTILGVSMAEMFSRFEDLDPNSVDGSGDVKYHIGAQGEHFSPEGRRIAIELISNPSHLEAVDPVVEGSTRARQDLRGDTLRQIVIPVLIHGDAAFAGQGVVAETLNLSQLGGYRTGGTVHLVVNNQIGFTTSPTGARSSLYCTDVARTVQAPIFHVNGDDPEAVLRAVELAYTFRRQFGKDVVVDIVCYRRHGHNEADDPSLTAPVLYRKIDAHPSVRVLYQKALVDRGVIASEEDAERQRASIKEQLSEAASAHFESAVVEPEQASSLLAPTAVPLARLQQVGERLCDLPESFHLHPKLRSFVQRRRQALAGESGIDWSLAEALALGSLALDSISVRLSGQDTGRGTFSQRHSVLYDNEDGSPYIALAHLDPRQRPVEIYDSLLSEEAALGFEFGYALSHPNTLVIWEAQFGDFANGAQVIIDQFISASRKKWGRTCGLCLLLPHGYEGQGPEHSSARIERFLQLSADENWRIANCSTAGQYFHLLRSQGLQQPQRPLVIFTPKSLLRNPVVASPLSDLSQGSFQTLIPDPETAPDAVQRILLCSGKVYYDLTKARQATQSASTAIVRVEQLYPFPTEEIAAEITRYPALQQIRWVQEEPENMGGWTFVEPRLRALAPPAIPVVGISRRASSSPATGSVHRHQQEQAALVEQAFSN